MRQTSEFQRNIRASNFLNFHRQVKKIEGDLNYRPFPLAVLPFLSRKFPEDYMLEDTLCKYLYSFVLRMFPICHYSLLYSRVAAFKRLSLAGLVHFLLNVLGLRMSAAPQIYSSPRLCHGLADPAVPFHFRD